MNEAAAQLKSLSGACRERGGAESRVFYFTDMDPGSSSKEWYTFSRDLLTPY